MSYSATDEAGGPPPSKSTYDPGWNDPPLFSYDTTSAPKRSAFLKKRVAFPLSSTTAAGTSPSMPASFPPAGNAPPPIAPGTAPLLSISTDTARGATQETASNIIAKEEGLKKVLENFETVLNTEAYDFKKNGSEIRRRLEVMRRMWEEDKLRPEIHTKMVQLAEALRNGDSKMADHIHKSLMVDYVSQCSPWMAGVRHLIHCVQSQNEPSEES